jgi:RNA polymerase sigma-70 factor (ECF subfamily)
LQEQAEWQQDRIRIQGRAMTETRQGSSSVAADGAAGRVGIPEATGRDLAAVSALAGLFRSQYGQLLRFCRMRVRNRADAEDIVQGAFLAARRAYPGKGEDELRPLLFTLVRNRAINHLKSVSRQRRTFGTLEEAGDRLACARSATPERQVMDAQQLGIVEAVIAAMPERRREALRLHRFDGLTYDEIAARLSVSATTAKTDVAQAVAEIAEGLARAGEARQEPAG